MNVHERRQKASKNVLPPPPLQTIVFKQEREREMMDAPPPLPPLLRLQKPNFPQHGNLEHDPSLVSQGRESRNIDLRVFCLKSYKVPGR